MKATPVSKAHSRRPNGPSCDPWVVNSTGLRPELREGRDGMRGTRVPGRARARYRSGLAAAGQPGAEQHHRRTDPLDSVWPRPCSWSWWCGTSVTAYRGDWGWMKSSRPCWLRRFRSAGCPQPSPTCGAIAGDRKKLFYVTSLVLIVAVPMTVLMPWVVETSRYPRHRGRRLAGAGPSTLRERLWRPGRYSGIRL